MTKFEISKKMFRKNKHLILYLESQVHKQITLTTKFERLIRKIVSTQISLWNVRLKRK
jgi:hypothetical protein